MLTFVELNRKLMIEGQENYLLVVNAQGYQLEMSVVVFHTYLEEFV